MVRIAIDAMGGDHAPLAIVRGAEAAAAVGAGDLVLVGDENAIGPLLQSRSGIDIVHAPTSVEMKESPSTALRKKKDSSINVAFSLLKAGDVQAVVLAGNSGAFLAFAIFTLGRLPGVERPAILTIHPNVRGTKSILLDSGGTVDCRPSHLVQFAIMGDMFAKCTRGAEPQGRGFKQRRGSDEGKRAYAGDTRAPFRRRPQLYGLPRGDGPVQRHGGRRRHGRLCRQRGPEGKRGRGRGEY